MTSDSISKKTHIYREAIGSPKHLTCLLRNLYAGQEATVRTGHGTTDWFQIGKESRQGCILLSCLFNLYAEYIMRNAGLDEAQLESRFPGETSTTSDMQITPLIAEREEELKSLLMRVKVRSLSRVRLFATPVDCSLPGSSVHGILQARILEWVAISFSRDESERRVKKLA